MALASNMLKPIIDVKKANKVKKSTKKAFNPVVVVDSTATIYENVTMLVSAMKPNDIAMITSEENTSLNLVK